MSRRTVRKKLLHSLSRTLAFVSSPFVKASTLAEYSTAGFLALGGVALCVYLYFLFLGSLSYPLSRANPTLQVIYKLLSDKAGLKFIPDSMATLAIIPLLAYLAVGAYKPLRLWMGEKFANLILWLAGLGIESGEWCIEHRWQSLIIIIGLAIIFTAGVTQRFGQVSKERILRRDFADWLTHAEDFVGQSPVAKPEYENYSHVKTFWRKDFGILHVFPGGYHHPAVCLNNLLDLLYGEQRTEEWIETLRANIDQLEIQAQDCQKEMRINPSRDEEMAWGLMNVLLGRINVRLADTDSDDQRLAQTLTRALAHFSAVKLQELQPSAINGSGTVYAHVFSAYLSTGEGGKAVIQSQALRAICPNAYECAVNALNSYEKSAAGALPCSFLIRRKTNNITDLLNRIAMNYDTVVRDANTGPLADWVSTPSSLGQAIRSRISDLMGCNDHEPVLSSFFLTSAQGFGASAKLRMRAGEDPSGDIESAGSYLRLANSFERNGFTRWELSYFCPALEREDTKAIFVQSLIRSFSGLPNAERLTQAIERKCR